VITPSVTKLVNSMLAGDKKALAQLISLAENESQALPEILDIIRPHRGKAYLIGVTGPPGAGKSTLVDKLVSMLDAFGKDIVIIETVGVGQTELSITQIADILVLVLVPESGDDIQALKAGISELADIIVINKADRGGAERLVDEFKAMGACGHRKSEPAVMATQAINNIGIEELYQEIDKRRKTC